MTRSYQNTFVDLPVKRRFKYAIVVMSALLFTASCSTISVTQRRPHQPIDKQRDNIVTSNNLSTKTNSMLLSAGIERAACLADFETCMRQLNTTILDKSDPESLALFSELHMAKAKSLASKEACQKEISRPPIDPYYANAPIPKEQQNELKRQQTLCLSDYRHHTLDAIRNSYAYLFYDKLQSNLSRSNKTGLNDIGGYEATQHKTKNQANYLARDLDVQTQDVYEAASDNLIKQIYNNFNNPDETLTLHPLIRSHLIDASQTNNNKGKTTGKTEADADIQFGEQIKLLNATFTPVATTNINSTLSNNADLPLQNNNDNKAGINGGRVSMQSQHSDSKVIKSKVVSSNLKDIESKNLDLSKDNAAKNISNQPVSIDVYVPNEPEYLQNKPPHNHRISKLYADHDLEFSGLNTISQRDGLGVSYVTLFEDRNEISLKGLLRPKGRDLNSKNPEDRIHLTGNVLLSGVVLPKGDSVDKVLNSHHFDVNLYNPYHTATIDIFNEPYYLAANFSASYGMWLSENSLENVSYFSLLSKQQSLVLPQLYMLEPYDPNKRIIIMLHGLASSPATWVSVTNDILNDSTLRDNYQVWQIFYPTNIPMLENRYQIQKLIETAYKQNDPNGQHLASQHSVLIGHSMGGVIARMLISNENLEAKMKSMDSAENAENAEQDQHLSQLINTQIDEQNIRNRLHLKKLDSVDTTVFISAPLRGTDFADRWFTRALRSIVQLPLGFMQTITGNLESIASEGELKANPIGALYLENGASQLSDQSHFMKLTADLEIADDVTYYSIIASNDSDILKGLADLGISAKPETALAETSSSPLNTADINDSFEDIKSLNSLNAQGSQPVPKVIQNVQETLTPSTSDGIVPYSSAHLEGAAGEVVLSGGHGIHESPAAILTLRKILHTSLEKHPISADLNKSAHKDDN